MKEELADEVVARFLRVAGKYQGLEKRPLVMAGGKTVHASELHMAVAIGEGRARTATELAALFGVTKGAVSQAVKKLEAKGLLARAYGDGNEKTRLLSLTEEGRGLPALHERLHGKNMPLFGSIKKRYTTARMRGILEFLLDAERLIDGLSGDGE